MLILLSLPITSDIIKPPDSPGPSSFLLSEVPGIGMGMFMIGCCCCVCAGDLERKLGRKDLAGTLKACIPAVKRRTCAIDLILNDTMHNTRRCPERSI